MNVNLLLVDDHPMMLDALRHAISRQPQFTIVGTAASGESALKLTRELAPDLVVMDIHLPIMSGLEATRQILKLLPATKILLFSGDGAGGLVDEALQAGACGYIYKRGSGEELIQAMKEEMAGKLCLSPQLSAAIVESHQRKLTSGAEPSRIVLSLRERQLLGLVSLGHRNKEIAAKLKLNPNSIETFRARLMKKIGCRSTAELVRYAIREGITPV
jgi:DNA-binding NarL/FixJ family response regulator